MNRSRIIFISVIWFILAAAGFAVLLQYESKPGSGRVMENHWPSDSDFKPAAMPYTLVMGVHPRCPCTRATIEELAVIMTHGQGQLKGYVLFIQPADFNEDWVKTDTYRSASSIPGIQTMIDRFGKQAELFHITTSGQTLVYDKRGNLLFNGGITSARGHVGDNDGVNSILELIRTGKASHRQTPFFGCPLFK